MPEFSSILMFLSATFLLNITPGPDMLYVATRSVSQGKYSGFISSLGISAGCLVHTFLVAFGLSELLVAVPAAYDAVRLAGAGYLIYLGVRSLFVKITPLSEKLPDQGRNLISVFNQGVLTNVLNPKVALFFLAFLPQFVNYADGNVSGQIILLGMLFITSGTLVLFAVVMVASTSGTWLKSRMGESAWFGRITGLVFIGLGIRLILMKKPVR